MANKMEPDVEYQVAIPKMTSLKDKNEPQIVIIDRDTGVHLQKTYWHKGLHQFLQLKHGLRLTALSTKAVFISNITFLKKFQCIYGFSGTLGSEAEKKELNKFYGLKSVIIPSSNVKQFYEEQTIITNSETAQKEEIFEVVKQKMAEGRSVLIIADSVKEVNQIFENVKILAECNLSENECKPFEEAILYKRDSDQFEYNDGKTELQPHTLIIATPLASRGTNIKLSPTLISQGGLHVIISFLPKNIRIEEQAFGRAARCGERGTAQLIICEKSVKNVNSANIKELKFKRDANEKERIEKMQKIYETKLEVEKDCLKEFGPKYLEIIKKEVDDKFAEILSKDLRDSWALFLDKSEYECDNDKEKRISATIKFCKNLNIDRMNGPTQPLNILNYAVHLMKNEEWKKANKLLEKVCRQFPAYLPEAQYYSIFIIAKKKEEQKQFQQAENQLCKARNGFAKRLLNYQKLSQIVNEHKIVEENRIFECDTFLQQQKESIKLFDQVIESIDDFFGRIISPFSFITDRICAEASMFLYKRFSSSKYYGKNPPITGLKIKKEINEKNLKNYCQLNGFCAENVIKSLETLEKFENINIKMIQKEMKIPKWEEFWAVLKEKGCLRDEKMHMFVNTLKLPQLSASKIDDKYFIGSDSGDSVDRLFQHLICHRKFLLERIG
uniref:Uncharacterized protein n=1 Tax=Panagrolaimus superbus TaxID=310955 RepID=A0A914Z8Q9_9BILA